MSDNDDYDDDYYNDQQVSTRDNDNQVSSGSSNGRVPSNADEYDYSKTEDVKVKQTKNTLSLEAHTKEEIHFKGNK
ncbi:hypothetical protein B9Z55_015803 [Caenorhabditis nigoni]|uniref:Uncharacterized protein n=1 Tax=Caenorhabditis nigoni TaxID=1611254 RepID=A0A2G5UBX2_9PELO|nr:hypothetical protein B9Z55_015803 [Caenorhabditis nigoni]